MVLTVSSNPGISPVWTLSPSISVLHVLSGLLGPSSSALSCLFSSPRTWSWLSMVAPLHGSHCPVLGMVHLLSTSLRRHAGSAYTSNSPPPCRYGCAHSFTPNSLSPMLTMFELHRLSSAHACTLVSVFSINMAAPPHLTLSRKNVTVSPKAFPTLKKSFRACSMSECWLPRSWLNMNILVMPSTPSLLLTLLTAPC